jgi:metal-responsive CopG/Arc/MetJ family transcriptional regulator
MQETITLTLPKDIRSALDDLMRREGISPDDLIFEAIKMYLFLRQFRLLRERMIPKAQAQGIFTDQDVFDRVS